MRIPVVAVFLQLRFARDQKNKILSLSLSYNKSLRLKIKKINSIIIYHTTIAKSNHNQFNIL